MTSRDSIQILTTQKPEFKDLAGRVTWMQCQDNDQRENDPHPIFHGSCMLSKVAGRTSGLAKKARIILVRSGEEPQMRHWIHGLALVSEDLGVRQANPEATRAIVSLSFQWPPDGTDIPVDFWDLIGVMTDLLLDLEHKGALSLTGSGNMLFVSIANKLVMLHPPAIIANLF